MAIPILAGLAGLASAIGAGTGAYKLGTSIKDRNAANKAKQAKNVQPTAQQNQTLPGNSAKDRLLGTPNAVQQFQNLTPNQMVAQDLALKQALANLGSNQYDFAPIQDIAQQNFQRQTIPSIMARFGNQGGSDINNSLASSGVDLDRQLAALRSQHGLAQQALNQNLLKIGLQPQFENAFFPGSPGLLEGLGQSAATGQNFNDLYTYIKSLLANRNQGDSDQGLSPYENDEQAGIGEFSQNAILNNFVNKAQTPANNSLNGFQQLYGTNFQAPGTTSSYDALKLLHPNAKI